MTICRHELSKQSILRPANKCFQGLILFYLILQRITWLLTHTLSYFFDPLKPFHYEGMTVDYNYDSVNNCATECTTVTKTVNATTRRPIPEALALSDDVFSQAGINVCCPLIALLCNQIFQLLLVIICKVALPLTFLKALNLQAGKQASSGIIVILVTCTVVIIIMMMNEIGSCGYCHPCCCI